METNDIYTSAGDCIDKFLKSDKLDTWVNLKDFDFKYIDVLSMASCIRQYIRKHELQQKVAAVQRGNKVYITKQIDKIPLPLYLSNRRQR